MGQTPTPTPMGVRPISLASIIYRTYTGIRFKHTKIWQAKVLPRNIFGGRAHSGTLQAEWDHSIAKHLCRLTGHEMSGAILDRTKCFDLMKQDVALALMLIMGCDEKLISLLLWVFIKVTRKEWLSTVWLATNSAPRTGSYKDVH